MQNHLKLARFWVKSDFESQQKNWLLKDSQKLLKTEQLVVQLKYLIIKIKRFNLMLKKLLRVDVKKVDATKVDDEKLPGDLQVQKEGSKF